MSVNPGYSGQTFMPEMIGKVEEIRNKLNALRSQPGWKWMAALLLRRSL